MTCIYIHQELNQNKSFVNFPLCCAGNNHLCAPDIFSIFEDFLEES